MGKSGIYPDKAPVFSRHEGEKAAKLRSADLSRMARGALGENISLYRSIWYYY